MRGYNVSKSNLPIPSPTPKQSALYLIQYLLNVYYDVEKKIRSFPIPACEAVGMGAEPEEFKRKHPNNCNCLQFDKLFYLAQFHTKLIGLKSQVFDDCNKPEKLLGFLLGLNYITGCGNIQDLSNVRVRDTRDFQNESRFKEINFQQLNDYSHNKFVSVLHIDIIRLLCIYLIIEEYDYEVFHGMLYLLGDYGHANEQTDLFLNKDYAKGSYLYVCGETPIGKSLYRCVQCYIKSSFYSWEKENVSIISTVYQRIEYEA